MNTRIIAITVLLSVSVLFNTFSQGIAGLSVSNSIDVYRVKGLDGDYVNKDFYQTKSYADLSASRITLGWFWRKNEKRTNEVFASISSNSPLPYTYYEREDAPLSYDFFFLSVGYQSDYLISKSENRTSAIGFSSSLYNLNFRDISNNRYTVFGEIQQETLGLLFNLVLKHTYSIKRFEFCVTSVFRFIDFNYSRHIDHNIGRYPDDNIDNILSEGFSLKFFPAAYTLQLGVAYKFKSE